MDREKQPGESPFSKALSYLNFNPRAKWLAYLAGGAVGVVLVLLLIVLWLFSDLMVWRGRVPTFRELSPKQAEYQRQVWETLSEGDRKSILERARFSGPTVQRLLAVSLGDMNFQERELVWQELAWDILHDRISLEAAQQVFLPDDTTQSGFVLDPSDHGVLSLVVREAAAGRHWTPIPTLAQWNSWMWNGPVATRGLLPTYLTGLAIIVAILGLMWGLLVVLNREMAARATIEATNRLRRAVYHHTFRLGTLAVRALGPSEAVSILTRHVEALHDALYTYLTVTFKEGITLGLFIVLALLIDPILAGAFLLFTLVVWQAGLHILRAVRNQTQLANDVAAERLTIIRESLMLMRLVKCYIMEQFNQARIERQLARYGQVQRIRHRGESLAQPTMIVLGGACALILLFVAGLLMLYGQLSTGGAVVLATTLLSLYFPIVHLRDSRKLLKRGKEAAEQIFGFLERRGDVGQVVGADFLQPLAKQLEFDNVNLREPGTSRPLLEEVSITIQAGQRVGLVGADNHEKHALVYLIPRLLDPTSGEIRIDDNNLRWVTLDSLRHQIGVVMMHNLVFHDTVRNNIGCGDSTYTLPQIIEAAKMAHAHNFIQKLPEGYETPLGELGHVLTLSQQYRVALARAILRDPAILIIEEPDQDLDDDTKNQLDDTLARVLPGRTAIFLPHRISTLKACNTIHLINKGRIVDSGTHKELLARNKLYRHLHYLEFNQMDEMV
ncbi:MAG: ABC transporter ATP-binding protein [Gemmataceae bacterium]